MVLSAEALTRKVPPLVSVERVTDPRPEPETAPDISTVPPPEEVKVTVAGPLQVTVVVSVAR